MLSLQSPSTEKRGFKPLTFYIDTVFTIQP